MPNLNPPVELEHPNNQMMVDYIQNVSSLPSFEYPPVSGSMVFHDFLFVNS